MLGENMAFFAKSRRKLRTKNFEAHFHKKLRTLEKCSTVKKLRKTEPRPIFTGSYKKKCSHPEMLWLAMLFWPYFNNFKSDFHNVKRKVFPTQLIQSN